MADKRITRSASPDLTARQALKELKKSKAKDPEKVAKDVSKELAVLGLPATENVKIKNPITGKEVTVELSRTGTQESDLIVALADPDLARDRKDHALSMYLWGRGAESASLIVDLMRYKGAHTKETRVFKSQMRFDFEAFVKLMEEHLMQQAKRTEAILGVNIQGEIAGYREWLSLPNNKGKDYTYFDYKLSIGDVRDTTEARVLSALVSEAIFNYSESKHLKESRDRIVKAREAEKGGGIFVDGKGRVFSVNDPEIDEIIKADREAAKSIEEDKDL